MVSPVPPLPQAHPRCLVLDRLDCFTVFLAELAFSLLKRHSPPSSSPRHCLAAESCRPNPSFQHSLLLPSGVPSSVALHPYSQMGRGILTSAYSFSWLISLAEDKIFQELLVRWKKTEHPDHEGQGKGLGLKLGAEAVTTAHC